MCTFWSSANKISNFKFSAFFRVLFALWPLKYPRPKSQQAPRVSTELEMVINLLYSFIPLQKYYKKVSIAQLRTRRRALKISKWRRIRRTIGACADEMHPGWCPEIWGQDFKQGIAAILLWQTVNVTFVLEYLHHDFLRTTFEFSVWKTTLRTTKLPSSRVLCLQQAQTNNSYRYER